MTISCCGRTYRIPEAMQTKCKAVRFTCPHCKTTQLQQVPEGEKLPLISWSRLPLLGAGKETLLPVDEPGPLQYKTFPMRFVTSTGRAR